MSGDINACIHYTDANLQADSGYAACPDQIEANYPLSGSVVLSFADKLDAGLRGLPSELTLDEGASGQFSVRLTTSPEQNSGDDDVTVTIALPAASTGVVIDTDPNTSGSQNTLTFTGDNWGTVQTVYISTTEDDDDDHARVGIGLSASGGGSGDYSYDSVAGGFTLTLRDTDRGEAHFNPLILPDITQVEGVSFPRRIALSRQPDDDVTVALSTDNPDITFALESDVSTAITELTFTEDNWDDFQVFLTFLADDSDSDNDTATVTLTASGGGFDGVTASYSVTVIDSDEPNIIPSRSPVVVYENGIGTVDVRLSQAVMFSGVLVKVNLNITSSDSSLFTVSPAVMEFDGSPGSQRRWDEDQTLTITPVNDSVFTSAISSAEIVIAASDDTDSRYNYAGFEGRIPVQIIDDEVPPGLVLTPQALTLDEGGSGRFTVQLASQPSAGSEVTVTLAQPAATANSSVTFGPASLTFTDSNWSRSRTVTVNAGQDADGQDEKAGIALSAAGGSYAGVTGSAAITVTDDDTAGLVLPETSLTVDEGGSSTFKVWLATQPTAGVTLTLAQPSNTDVTVDTDPVAAGNQNTLTFTGNNWSAAQTVTVNAGRDADSEDDSASIALSTAGGDYADIKGSVGVTVADSDKLRLSLSAATLSVREGQSIILSVGLSSAPSGNVEVELMQPSNTDVTLDTDSAAAGNQTTLNFTDANWETRQDVTVSVAEDSDSGDETAIISLSASGGGYDGVTGQARVDVSDDDGRAGESSRGLTVTSASRFVVYEHQPVGSLYARYRLTTKPTGNVTVTAASSAPDIIMVPSAHQTHTFTPATWDQPFLLTLHHARNSIPEDLTATVTLTASGADYEGVVNRFDVILLDSAGLQGTQRIRSIPASLHLLESGGSEIAHVILDGSILHARNTIRFESSDTSVFTVSPATVSWSSDDTYPAVVTVTPVQDVDSRNETATINVSTVRGAYPSLAIPVTVQDDLEGLVVSRSALTLSEGGVDTFTVRLGFRPTETVSVAIASLDPGAASTSLSSLTFDRVNWQRPQRVVVTGVQDMGGQDERTSIQLSASGGNYDDAQAVSIAVSVIDDEKFVLSKTALIVDEGDSDTFSIRLKERPGSSVAVVIASEDAGVALASPSRLTFDAGNWSTPQTVTVSGVHDDGGGDESTVLQMFARGGFAQADSLQVLVRDDEQLVLSQSDLQIAEGQSRGLTVRLNSPPTAVVTVAPTISDATKVSISPSSLRFTAGNWNNPQTLTVSAAQDIDSDSESIVVTLSASGGSYTGIDRDVGVSVEDDEGPKLLLSAAEITLQEGGDSADFSVRLRTRPSSTTLTVSLASADSSAVTVSPGSLTFTRNNWYSNQTVTVSPVSDSDPADERVAVNLVPLSGNYAGFDAAVTVLVEDGDSASFNVPSSVSLTEGGSDTFSVQLLVPPSDDVMLTLVQPAASDVTLDTDPLTSGSQNILRFAAASWNTPQTVQIAAARDADSLADTATIFLSAAGGGYDAAFARMTVEVLEPELVVTSAVLELFEGASGSIMVSLSAQPSDSVTVSAVSTDGSRLAVSEGASLTFTTSNWNVPQSVRLSAGSDADSADNSVTVNLTASGGGYGGVSAARTVEVLDGSLSDPLYLSPGSLSITEGGSGTFVVRTRANPNAARAQIVLQSADLSKLRVTPAAFYYGTSNYQSLRQTITVSALDDSDGSDENFNITLSITGGDQDGQTQTMSVSVRDDDVPSLNLPTSRLAVEEGESLSFGVSLRGAAPLEDVTLSLAVSAGSTVTVDDTDPVAPGVNNSLIFTPENWDVPQTVTISAAEDADAVGESAVVSVSTSGGGYSSVPTGQVAVRVRDDDLSEAALSVTGSPLKLAEGGASRSFNVVLTNVPIGNVVVRAQSSDPDLASVTAGGALTFTSGNWHIPQSVSVLAPQDADADDETVTVNLTASGGGYDNTAASAEISISDDDVVALVLSAEELTVNEGSDGSFTVQLATRPLTDVSVTLSSDRAGSATVSPTALEFSASNWNIPQSVAVNPVQDLDAVDDENVGIILFAAGGNYEGITSRITVNITDDESNALVLSKTSLGDIREGDTAVFTVALSAEPTAEVTVRLTISSGLESTQEELRFDSSSWNVPQSVTVLASEDDDDIDTSSAGVTLSASGGGYGSAEGAVTARVLDNDVRTIVPSTTSLRVIEGSAATFTFRLSALHDVDSNISVQVTGADGSDLSVDLDQVASGSQKEISFPSSDWKESRTVTVIAGEDDDQADDTVTLNLVSAYTNSTPASVTVVIDDNDIAGLGLSSDSLVIEEGDDNDFTVQLNRPPSGTVRVRLTQANPANGDIELDTDEIRTGNQEELEFTVSNWSTPQTVRVSAGEDDDAIPDAATINLSAFGGGYAGVTDSISISVEENDETGFVLTPASKTVALTEGAAAETLTLRLASRPSRSVTVHFDNDTDDDGVSDLDIDTDLSTPNDLNLTVAFTTTGDDWKTPRNVSFRAKSDDDGTPESFEVELTAAGGDYEDESDSIAVSVTDDDAPALVLSATAIALIEQGAAESLTVKLATQPSDEVTVTVGNSDSAAVRLSSASLTFDDSNWSTAQTLTLNGSDDSDATDETVSVSFSASGAAEYAGVRAGVSVTVDDNDTTGVTASINKLELTEHAPRNFASFTLQLATQPKAAVELTLSNSREGAVATSPSSLTFTPSDWNVQQTVTVVAFSDADAADEELTLNVSASGGGYGDVTTSVAVSVTDDDSTGLVLSSDALALNEGSAGMLSVKLSSKPSDDVAVTVTHDNPSALSLNPSSLAFTPINWNVPQSVTVASIRDADSADEEAIMTFLASGGGYVNVSETVDIDVADGNQPALNISRTRVSLGEGATQSLMVSLAAPPTGEVSLELISDSDAAVTVTPDSLTFTTDDWNSQKTFTLEAPEDDDALDASASITLSASDGNYDDVTGLVSVAVNDDETAGLELSASSLRLVEGAEGSIDIRLASRPAADAGVTLTLEASSSDIEIDTDPDTAGSQNTLTFAAADWEDDQSVTITAPQDSGTDDETVAITISASGGDYDIVNSIVSVDIEDDDIPGLSLSRTSLEVDEDDSATFGVKLRRQPGTAVVVTLAVTGDPDVTIADTDPNVPEVQATLTFTTTNWSDPQTVTVRAAEDEDGEGEVVAVDLSAAGGGYDDVRASVSVSVNDDDEIGMTLSESSLVLAEGSNVTGLFTVLLKSRPTGDVSVAISNSNPLAATVSPTALTFTPSNWNDTQTVTVTAPTEDENGSDETATITLNAGNGGYSGQSGSVVVTVTDNDTAGLRLSQARKQLSEGGSDTFTLRLRTQPLSDVTVSVASSDRNAVTAAPSALTFTAANWNEAQTVTVSAVGDSDLADERATLTLSASGGGYSDQSASVLVEVTDDANIGLELSADSLSLTEASTRNASSFTVALGSRPSANVTVNLSSGKASAVQIAPSSLTFSAAEFRIAQTVHIVALPDEDVGDEEVTIAIRAMGGDYEGVSRSLTVQVEDDDDPAFRLSPTPLTVNEGSSSALDVRLGARPTGDVKVAVSSSHSAAATVTPASLTFTTENWQSAQALSVTGVQDADNTDTSTVLVFSASGGGYAGLMNSVSVDVHDDDDASLNLSKTAMVVAEGGSDSFTLRLAVLPTAGVTVRLSSPNPDIELDVDSSTPGNQSALNFTTSNWNRPHTVTVTAREDDDAILDVAAVSLAAEGGNYSGRRSNVRVTVTENESVGLTLSDTSLELSEGRRDSFAVVLDSEPSADVTVTLRQPANGDVRVDTDRRADGNQNTLSFTPENWNIPQTVNIFPAQDADRVDDTATVELSAAGGDYAAVTASLSVSVDDDDDVGIQLTDSELTVREGLTVGFGVRLTKRPSVNVTVTIPQPAAGSGVSVDTDRTAVGNQNQLTFTPVNWYRNQFVSLAASEDDNAQNSTLTLSLQASGGNYDDITGSLRLTVRDSDERELVLSESGALQVPENASSTFDVRLSAQPSDDVTVTLSLSSDSSTDISVDTDVNTSEDQDELTFTPANWSRAQTVTVSAAADEDAQSDTGTINLNAAGAGYEGLRAALSVNVRESNRAELRLSQNSIQLDEAEETTFTVRLASQPSDDVSVTWHTDNSDVTLTADLNNPGHISHNSLEFDDSNWQTPQTVALSVASDNDAEDEKATVDLSATGGDYEGAATSLEISIEDADTVGLMLSETVLTVQEGSTATFTIKLSSQPGDDVTVTLAQPANTDVTADTDNNAAGNQNTLTFTRDNWNQTQSVTVAAIEDDDTTDDGAAIVISARGGGYDAIQTRPTVNVSVDDPDTVGLKLSVTELVVGEGGSNTFKVELGSDPQAEVTVSVADPSNSDISLQNSSMTFTSDNWNRPQMVTVSAAQDADGANETEELSLSAAGGGGYEGKSSTIAVIIEDDEPVGVSLSATTLTVEEGGESTFTVSLSTPPIENVTLALSQSPVTSNLTIDTDADAGGTQNTLTFTPENSGVPKTVTVSAPTDQDGADESSTISVVVSGGSAEYLSAGAELSVVVDDAQDDALVLSQTALNIGEGERGSITIELATEPDQNVTVTVKQPDDSDIRVDTDLNKNGSQQTLFFSSANWGNAQTVYISAVSDDDTVNDTGEIEITASGGRYSSVDKASLTVNVRDDDSLGLTLSPTSLTVVENSSAVFDISLNSRPSDTVRLTFGGHRESDVVVDADGQASGIQEVLIFEPDQWRTPQTVTVSAESDSDAIDDPAVRVQVSAQGGNYSGQTAYMPVSVTDTETIGFSLSESSLQLPEGSDVSFTVKLNSEPSADVQVSMSQSALAGTRLQIASGNADAQNQLTFTPANWNAEQTVTLSAAEDLDAIDDTVTIALSATGGDYQGETGSLAVEVLDRDRAALVLSAASLSLEEGATDTITVRLRTQPSDDVGVVLTQSSNSSIELDTNPILAGSQNTLNFSASNWQTEQTVRLTAAEDADAVDNEEKISLLAIGGDYSGQSAELTVSLNDNDAVGLEFGLSSLDLDEGSSSSFSIALASQPSANVTLRLMQPENSDITLDTNTESSGNQTLLTFSRLRWDQAQDVTVSAKQDADAVTDTANIRIQASGGNYADQTFTTSISVDEDERVGFVLPRSALTMAEDDRISFSVSLTSQPVGGSVSVTLMQPDNPDVTVDTDSRTAENQNTLTFTALDWDTPQSVIVNSVNDSDGAVDEAVIRLSATGADYAAASGRVTVEVTDNEPPGLRIDPARLTITEGASGVFTVRIDDAPSSDVSIRLVQPNNEEITLDTNPSLPGNQNALTFNAGNWNVPQPVTVSAKHDSDGIDDLTTITMTASGTTVYDNQTGSVVVTVTDDDKPKLILSPEDKLIVDEGGNNSFTVRLNNQPSSSVTVTLVQPDNTDITLDTDTDADGRQLALHFTQQNWETPQSVRVDAAQDADAVRDTEDIQISAAGGDYAGVSGTLTIEVDDDEAVALQLSATDLEFKEGSSDIFTVRLDSRPTGDVTVTLVQTAESANSDITADTDGVAAGNQDTLTFTVDNWDDPQDVTVAAIADDDAVADTTTYSLTAAGGGYEAAESSIAITVSDDSGRGLTLSAESLSVTEPDPADAGNRVSPTFTVVLDTQPTGDVTVALVQPDNTDVQVDTDTSSDGNQTSLTFTSDNWSTPQTVTLIVRPDVDGVDDRVTIRLTASGADYEDANVSAELAVTVSDRDETGLTLAPGTVNLVEGAPGTFTVRLSTLPTETVSVNIAVPDDSDLVVDTDSETDGNQTSLSFTTEDWDTPKSVAITARSDEDATSEFETLNLSASGSDEYAGVTATLRVNIEDSNDVGLRLSAAIVTVGEGERETLTVRLDTQPTGDVSVALSASNSAVTFTPADLDFTSENWNEDQEITIGGVEDADAAEARSTLTLTSSGSDYAGVSDTVTVIVNDDEVAELRLSTLSLKMGDDTSASFTVRLANLPTDDVSVALMSNSASVSVEPASLSFTAISWNTPQTVSVTSRPDDDAENDQVQIDMTASGVEYEGAAASVGLRIDDSEELALEVSAVALSLTEGGAGTFAIQLSHQPVGPVTVQIRSEDAAAAVAAPNTLSFNSDNWDTARTVTVTGVVDSDTDNENVTLNISAFGSSYSNISEKLAVEVSDRDVAHLVVSPASLSFVEGGSPGHLRVRLGIQPRSDVLISAGSSVPGSLRVTEGEQLTFTRQNWDTPQLIELTPVSDANAHDEHASITILADADGDDYDGVSKIVTVKVEDQETPALILSDSTLLVKEGRETDFTVRLSSPPASGTVTVSVSSSDDVAATVQPETLTFNSTNWNLGKAVALISLQDGDLDDETVTIELEAQGGGYSGIATSLTATVTDFNRPNLDLSDDQILLTEGGNNTFSVRLAQQPEGPVTVGIANSNSVVSTLSATRLDFDELDWNVPQNITLTAEEDVNALDEREVLTLTASGSGYDGVMIRLPVLIRDDEDSELVFSVQSLSLNEGGDAEFTVKLPGPPTGNVTLTILSDDEQAVTVSPGQLTFGTADWNAPQTVTATSLADADADDERVALNFAASGGSYTGISSSIAVSITDTSNARLVLSADALSVDEGGSQDLTVKLNSQPSGNVTVSVANNSAAALATPLSLIFTPNNWNIEQSLSISGSEDEDAKDDGVIFSLAPSGGGYAGLNRSISVTVDDDETVGLGLSLQDLTVVEGEEASFTARPLSRPSSRVTVSITAANLDIATVSPTVLIFTPDDWTEAKSLTVTARQDDDSDNAQTEIRFSASGGEYSGRTSRVRVNVNDDESSHLKLSAPVLMIEEGRASTFTVALTQQPSADVTVSVSTDQAAFTGLALSATATDRPQSVELTFTQGNWDVAQSVTVFTTRDADSEDETANISLSASGGDYAGKTGAIRVLVEDLDSARLDISIDDRPASALTVTEGSSGSFKVKLTAPPNGSVTVRLMSRGTSATLSEQSLTFDNVSWNQAQTVMVSAREDADPDDNFAFISLKAAGAGYDGVTASVAVDIPDNDRPPGLILSAAEVSVNEGETENLGVRLAAPPSTDVTLSVSMGDDAVVLSHGGKASPPDDDLTLTFTTTNWSTEQQIGLQGAQDPDISDEEGLTLTLVAAGGSYQALRSEVLVSVVDDDSAGIRISQAELEVTEGQGVPFRVSLMSQPSRQVTLRISSDNPAAASTSPARLIFTADSWNVDQTVMVTGVQDGDRDNESATVTLSGLGGEYAGLTASVAVTILDKDKGADAAVERMVAEQVLAEIARTTLIGTVDVINNRLQTGTGLRTANIAGHDVELSRKAVRDIASGFAAAAMAGAGGNLGASRFDGALFGVDRQSVNWLGGIALKDGAPMPAEPDLISSELPFISSFTYALGAVGGAGEQLWTLWGRYDMRDFSGLTEEIDNPVNQDNPIGADYDGDQTALWLGFDRELGEGTLLGLAFSRGDSGADYLLFNNEASLTTRMNTVLPYIEIGLDSGGSIQMMFGRGSGNVDINETSGNSGKADMSMDMMSIALNWPVGNFVNTSLMTVANVLSSRLSVERSAEAASISGLSVDSTLLRGGIELSHRSGFGDFWNFNPRLGMMVRQDSGDGITGTGIELTAGAKLAAGERFNVDLSMRWLGSHTADDVQEFGASLEMQVKARDPLGRGLSLGIRPEWGALEDGVLERDEVFRPDRAGLTNRSQAQRGGLTANFGFGMDMFGGLLTPYTEYRITQGDYVSARYTTGLRFTDGDDLEAKLFNEISTGRGPAGTSRIGLELKKNLDD